MENTPINGYGWFKLVKARRESDGNSPPTEYGKQKRETEDHLHGTVNKPQCEVTGSLNGIQVGWDKVIETSFKSAALRIAFSTSLLFLGASTTGTVHLRPGFCGRCNSDSKGVIKDELRHNGLHLDYWVCLTRRGEGWGASVSATVFIITRCKKKE